MPDPECICLECGERFPMPAVGKCPNGHRQIRRVTPLEELAVAAQELVNFCASRGPRSEVERGYIEKAERALRAHESQVQIGS